MFFFLSKKNYAFYNLGLYVQFLKTRNCSFNNEVFISLIKKCMHGSISMKEGISFALLNNKEPINGHYLVIWRYI